MRCAQRTSALQGQSFQCDPSRSHVSYTTPPLESRAHSFAYAWGLSGTTALAPPCGLGDSLHRVRTGCGGGSGVL